MCFSLCIVVVLISVRHLEVGVKKKSPTRPDLDYQWALMGRIESGIIKELSHTLFARRAIAAAAVLIRVFKKIPDEYSLCNKMMTASRIRRRLHSTVLIKLKEKPCLALHLFAVQ